MLKDHRVKSMPVAPKLKELIGPSFILLGLGLGSGELILWPYLTARYGMGIIWAAILGVTLQFFMNMEIERYTLTRGESIFVGFARLNKFLPYWFIFSTIIPWVWPGIAVTAAMILGNVFGIANTNFLAIILLLVVGIVLTLGQVLYKTQEFFQKIIILLGTPFVLLLSIFLARPSDWLSLVLGIVGGGNGYWFIPAGISLSSFLAAIAYSGAGGNLNLAQSFYIKEKGFGMGKYSGRITSLISGKAEDMNIEGARFVSDSEQIKRFKDWWKLINIEHGIIFWLMGTLTIVFLSFLSFATVFGHNRVGDISFIFYETMVLGEKVFPIIGTLFLTVAGLMLFSTQLGVLGTTSRILTENLTLLSRKHFPVSSIRGNFYLFLWLQIFTGIVIISFGFTQPLTLLTLSAVLNAGAMFVHIILTLILNLTKLDKPIRPGLFRIIMMIFAFIFFGFFTIKTIF